MVPSPGAHGPRFAVGWAPGPAAPFRPIPVTASRAVEASPAMDDSARTASTEELLSDAGWLRRLARRLTADADEAGELEQETWHAALTRPPKPGESLEFEVSNGAAAAERDWKALFAPLVIV